MLKRILKILFSFLVDRYLPNKIFFYIFISVFLAMFVAIPVKIMAQVEVSLVFPFDSQIPSHISEWNKGNVPIYLQVINKSGINYDKLSLSFNLTKDGKLIANSRDGHPSLPVFSLSGNEMRTLTWSDVIDQEAIEYDESIYRIIISTGEIPEGVYKLCIQILNFSQPVSNKECNLFNVRLSDPPVLLWPVGGIQLDNSFPLLQWSPLNTTKQDIFYQLTLKPLYRGQTPIHAMQVNPVRLQVIVPTTIYQIKMEEQLDLDYNDPNCVGFVWQVQALYNSQPYGRNQGLSQIEWFSFPPRPNQVDTFKTPISFHSVRQIPIDIWTSQDSLIYVEISDSIDTNEQVALVLRIHGLLPYETLPTLLLVNQTPSIILMEGGDYQTVSIKSEDVSPEGIFNYAQIITGLQQDVFTLSFQISAELENYKRCENFPKIKEKDIKCETKDDIGKIVNTVEITFTPTQATPGDVQFIIFYGEALKWLIPQRRITVPKDVIPLMINAIVKIVQTRGFDVWVRIGCYECQERSWWKFWKKSYDWKKLCSSDWEKVMELGGKFKVDEGVWIPIKNDGAKITWEEINQEAVKKAGRLKFNNCE